MAWTIAAWSIVGLLCGWLVLAFIGDYQVAKIRERQAEERAMQVEAMPHSPYPLGRHTTKAFEEEFRRMRKLVLARDGRRCVECGYTASVDVHHKIPRSEGGSNDLSNLVTLCPNCHRLAHRNRVVAKRRR